MRSLEVLASSLFAFIATDLPLVVALTVVCRMAPLLITTPPLTALAERIGRKTALVAAFGALTALFAALLLLEAARGIGVGLILPASCAAGVFGSLEFPLRRTLRAEVGGLARMGASMGLKITSNQITRAAGAMLGGRASPGSGSASSGSALFWPRHLSGVHRGHRTRAFGRRG